MKNTNEQALQRRGYHYTNENTTQHHTCAHSHRAVHPRRRSVPNSSALLWRRLFSSTGGWFGGYGTKSSLSSSKTTHSNRPFEHEAGTIVVKSEILLPLRPLPSSLTSCNNMLTLSTRARTPPPPSPLLQPPPPTPHCFHQPGCVRGGHQPAGEGSEG